jgi:hypothetical protein
VLRGLVQHVEADESAEQVLELHREQPLSTTENKGGPSPDCQVWLRPRWLWRTADQSTTPQE